MTAYDYVAESIVVAEGMHDHHVAHVSDVCQRGDKADNACSVILGGGSAADLRLRWVGSDLLALLLDQFPPLPCVAGDRSQRAYRVGLADLSRSAPASNERDAVSGRIDAPRLVSTEYDWGRLAALVATFLVIGLAAHRVALKSIRRLFFVDTLIALRSKRLAIPDAAQLACQVRKDRPILVMHAPPTLGGELRRLGCIDLTQGPQPPAALGQVVLVADLIELLYLPSAPQDLARAVSTGHPAIVLSSTDPWRRLTGERRRDWAKTLAGFDVMICGPNVAPAPDPRVEHDAAAEDEREAAFIKSWTECDDDEKRVLAQLVIDRHPSPHRANFATIGHLARRGLLDDCTLTIREPGFAAFIASEVTSADLDALERSEGPNAWKTLRVPLLTAGSVLVAMLGASSPELEATGTIFPAVFAAIQVVLRALGSKEPTLRT